MKLSTSLVFKWMALPAILAFVTTASAERAATVIGIAGNANYQAGGAGDLMPLSTSAKLHNNDVVKTGTRSHVDLNLGENLGVLRVAPNSNFTIKKLGSSSPGMGNETQLDLKSGAIYAKINKLPKGSVYEISTPRGIAGIRGTTIYLTAEGCLTVVDGAGAVAYPNNGGVQTFVVNGGNTICPGDAAARPAPADLIEDINRTIAEIGGVVSPVSQPLAPPLEPFVSPVLPGR